MNRKRLASGVFFAFLLLLASAAGAQDLSPQQGPLPSAEFAPGQILVRFRPGTTPERIQQIYAQQGVSIRGQVERLGVQVLRLPPGLAVEQAVDIFNRIPEVEFAEPNFILRIVEINDPGLANQWAPQKIAAPQAWLISEGLPAVVIAIVDTGVDYRHNELAPNLWANDDPLNGVDDDGNGFIDDLHGWDFVNNDGDPLDDHFHGTHVAGIAAATPDDNPAGLVGICPHCGLMAVKVLGADGSGTLDGVANGIVYAADNGAQVINMSLGGIAGSATLESAVNYAWNQGLVVVAAAGNDGADSRLYPAAYANVIAIASTNSSDYRSCFSNFGANYISVAAPGELIYSTTLVDANGQDTYGTFSGTSMATPHAAGLAGLLFSQDLSRTNAQVRSLMQSSAEDMGPSGIDPYFGYGRINAYRALTGDTTPTVPPSGLFSNDLSASGYAHARKLARDASGILHLVWHGRDGGQYRVLYAYSGDNGASWSAPQVLFASSAETFHPALAVDGNYVYVAFPSKDGSNFYRTFFARKPLLGGSWSSPIPLIGGSYNAVRPDLYLDPANGVLHLVASSLDDSPYVYYTSSGDGGFTWNAVRQINVDSTGGQRTRYADVQASGPHVYIAGRTVEFTFFGLVPRYRLFTIHSLNSGGSWSDLTELALYDGWFSGEYGASLAGVGDQLYLAYEHAGAIYFRTSNGGFSWSGAANLGSGAWPSLTQADDGQAWAIWESGGSLLLRHYTGALWDSTETLLAATGLNKGYYPNLKLGTSGSRVEWAAVHCSGAPYRLTFGWRDSGGGPLPTPTPTPTPTATPTPTPTPTLTSTPTATPTAAPTFTPTPTPSAETPMHIGDLDSQSNKLQKGTWKALVTITVHDANHNLVTNATVTGTFYQNGAFVKQVTCTTGSNGACTVDSGQFPSKEGKATFSVNSVTHPNIPYDDAANHDPDGDSNGTSITISK